MDLNREEALGLLFSHRAMILAYAYSILRDQHLAEDVFQEVALVVTKKHADLKDAESFPAWVRTITRYRALDAARKRKSDRVSTIDEKTLEMLEPHWALSGDPMVSSEALQRLRHCVKKLTDRARRLIDMRFERGQSCKAIAKQIGQSAASVYIAFSRIYRKLHECMRGALAKEDAVDVS